MTSTEILDEAIETAFVNDVPGARGLRRATYEHISGAAVYGYGATDADAILELRLTLLWNLSNNNSLA